MKERNKNHTDLSRMIIAVKVLSMKPNNLTEHMQLLPSLFSKNKTIEGRIKGAEDRNITTRVRGKCADAYLGHVMRVGNHKHTWRRFFINGHNVSKRRKEERVVNRESQRRH